MDYSTLVSTWNHFSVLSNKVDFICTSLYFFFVFQFRVTVTARSCTIFIKFIIFPLFEKKTTLSEVLQRGYFSRMGQDSVRTPITKRLAGVVLVVVVYWVVLAGSGTRVFLIGILKTN